MQVVPAALAVVVALSSTAWAALNLSSWRFRKPISVPPRTAVYAEFALDAEVYQRADLALDDVRIVDGSGGEIPYVLREWPGEETEIELPTTILNIGSVPRKQTSLELDAGTRKQPHNRVKLTVIGPSFLRRVAVDGSDDRKTWLRLRVGTIYRVTEGSSAELTTVSFPRSVFRYLRITIDDAGQPALTVDGAALVLHRSVPAREDRWFRGPVRSRTDPESRTSVATVDLGGSRRPVSRVVLVVSEPRAFARDARVAVSEDGQVWHEAGGGVITRASGATGPSTLLTGDARARYVRVSVENRDSPPIRITELAVYGVRRTVLFPITAGMTYRLYFGNATATTPQYDLARIIELQPSPPVPAAAALGPGEANPAYAAPIVRHPWTEENPLILWGAIGLTMVILLIIIVQTARRARRGPAS